MSQRGFLTLKTGRRSLRVVVGPRVSQASPGSVAGRRIFENHAGAACHLHTAPAHPVSAAASGPPGLFPGFSGTAAAAS
jgi:hypothetical protein